MGAAPLRVQIQKPYRREPNPTDRPSISLLATPRSPDRRTPPPIRASVGKGDGLPIPTFDTVRVLLRWLRFQRIYPIIQVKRGIGLTCFAEHVVLFWPRWKARSFVARLFREFHKPILHYFRFFETTALLKHALLPRCAGASATGLSATGAYGQKPRPVMQRQYGCQRMV